jgi:hypothetical protein
MTKTCHAEVKNQVEIESIDRMYLNVWQPGWPTVAGFRGSSSGIGVITTRPRR